VLRRVVTVLTTALAPVLLVAAPGWAPKYIFGTSAIGTCDLATAPRFQGSVTAQAFFAQDGQLYAWLLTVGTCGGGSLDVVVPQERYAFPVTVSAECGRTAATVQIRPGAATVGGVPADKGDAVKLTLDLAPATVVERQWTVTEPRSVYGALCAVDAVISHRDVSDVANVLNRLLLA